MQEQDHIRSIAENYLDEMLEAERFRDFAAWISRWHSKDLKGLTEEAFLKDLDLMERDLGAYKNREYFGVIQGPKNTPHEDSHLPSFRFVWKAKYEKNEALFVVGIRKSDGVWRPFTNSCSI